MIFDYLLAFINDWYKGLADLCYEPRGFDECGHKLAIEMGKCEF